LMAISGVISLFASPRIPFVPKRCFELNIMVRSFS
jgi:hypothetical protein